ncbi:hypothetical protein [Paracoccus sp. SJTW-4]|uniref:hypothetical protein n=1 Tax=Paracoccus sp. SJTW-4 TaxID=3078428 RepID=UPI0039ECA9FD
MPEPVMPDPVTPAPAPQRALSDAAGDELPEPVLPELVRLYLRNIALGFLLALVFTGLLLALDVAHLRHLTLEITGGWLAIVMLVAFNTIVFAGVQFAIAVMRMAEPGDPPHRGNRAPVTGHEPVAVPVPVRPRGQVAP